jgi:hypothetical protein
MNCSEVKVNIIAYVIYGDRTMEHEMDGACSVHVEGGQCTLAFGRKTEKRQLARHKRRWVDNIKVDLQ